MMNTYVYDCETLLYDWCVVFYDIVTHEIVKVANDRDVLMDILRDTGCLIGFNNKHYDRYIIESIASGIDPKETNDRIIVEGINGWELGIKRLPIIQVDLMDDLRVGTSLKSYEAHKGFNIVESSIPFDIDRPLKQYELNELVEYCVYDVESTVKLLEDRKDYIDTKKYLGKMCNLDEWTACSLTNAKLTAKLLGAIQKPHNDGREYEYPESLDTEIIPKEILDFFKTLGDLSIPESDLFKTNYVYTLDDIEIVYSWGGVHGSAKQYYSQTTEDVVVQNRDVASLYPSLICLYNYHSRNMCNPDAYKNLRDERIKAKHDGDKVKANALKTPLNTVSGAGEDKYNDLYDPKPTRNMRISGQLFLSMLIFKLKAEIPEIKFININTDGVMYEVPRKYLNRVDDICFMWSYLTGFELETDEISEVWIKDVNNLLVKMENGKVKKVGGSLNYGITNKGAMAINFNATIIKDAAIEYFINGIKPDVTINKCTDIFKFQIIAKASSKYSKVVHIVDGIEIPKQKCNRVYATKNEKFGNLLKLHKQTGSWSKIASLPAHCQIDNANVLEITDIDKDYYIDEAYKLIDAFIGKKV